MRRLLTLALCICLGLLGCSSGDSRAATTFAATSANVFYSPYNWYESASGSVQSTNPGAYFKMGFTGTSITVNLDVSPETGASIPADQYPIVRCSVDGKAPVTAKLTATTTSLPCATGLSNGNHTLQFQWVAGYVYLDFWTPVNVVRVTGFTLDDGASPVLPAGAAAIRAKTALFYGDSITNGESAMANFTDGITHATETQDATVSYVQPVAAALDAEYGIVAYGGVSWEGTAADGQTPGLMTSWRSYDASHFRLDAGRLSPVPDDIFINLGENSGPRPGNVGDLLTSLRAASSVETNIWVIIPFSGRARKDLTDGVATYKNAQPNDKRVFVLDTGNNPYLTGNGPTAFSVDGTHPLAALHSTLGDQLVQQILRQQ
jgi:Carbohydrate esterase 2 N-terminal